MERIDGREGEGRERIERTEVAGLALSADHPLVDELAGLRRAVERFQNEAHTAALKLQHHALDTAALAARATQLEADNALLSAEVNALRDHPAPASPSTSSSTAGSSSETVGELTLALRRLTSKLTLTEAALHEHALALVQANTLAAERARAAAGAYDLAARARGREEEGRQRAAALELEVRRTREEARMSDAVVREYADLVRRLEGRASSSASSPSAAANGGGGEGATPAGVLEACKAQLNVLMAEFEARDAAQAQRVFALEGQLGVAGAELAAARALSGELGEALGQARFQGEVDRVDDKSAAGMVERYMKFTQQTTAALHAALAALRARHDATLHTLHTQLADAHTQLRAGQHETARLRGALDEAGGALVRETVGRRREVAGRVRLVGREEGVVRGLEGVLGRTRGRRKNGNGNVGGEKEIDAREREQALEAELAELEAGVRGVLARLDSDPGAREGDGDGDRKGGTPGSEARMVLLESAVEMLVQELEGEVARRAELERERGQTVSRVGEGRAEMPVETTMEPAVRMRLEEGRDAQSPVAAFVDTRSARSPEEHASAARPMPAAPPLLPHIDTTSTEREHELHMHMPSPRLPPDGRLLEPDYPGEEGAEEGEEEEEDVGGENGEEDSTVQPGEACAEAQGEKGEGQGGDAHGEEEARKDEREPNKQDELEGPRGSSGDVLSSGAEEAPAFTLSVPSVVAFPSTAPDADVTPPSPETTQHVLGSPAQDVAAPAPLASSDSTSDHPVPPASPDVPATPAHPLLADLAAASERYDALQRAFRACHVALEALRTAAVAPPHAALRGAVARLHDYTEDARVELEIRVADARVLARGWETLARLPDDGADGGALQDFVRRDAQAQAAFQKKLDDVEHDIAVVKRALYAPPAEPSPTAEDPDRERDASGGWTAWLGGAPRTPPPEAPTFGSVMTSPRLRHSSSAARLAPRPGARNPLEGLGLRVAMPAYVPPAEEAVAPRQRTISGVYMLGLGVGGGRRPSALGMSPRGGVRAGARRGQDDVDVE